MEYCNPLFNASMVKPKMYRIKYKKRSQKVPVNILIWCHISRLLGMKWDQLKWRSSASRKTLFLYSGVLQHAAELGTQYPLKATKENYNTTQRQQRQTVQYCTCSTQTTDTKSN